jgi:hypothetical protein
MIAPQALVHRATLVTFNQDDFCDVPGLSSLVFIEVAENVLATPVSGAQPLHLLRQHQRGINLLFGRERRGFIPEGGGVLLMTVNEKRLMQAGLALNKICASQDE